jgi:hypothetical protein
VAGGSSGLCCASGLTVILLQLLVRHIGEHHPFDRTEIRGPGNGLGHDKHQGGVLC